MLKDFASVATAIAGTTRKSEKEKILAAYLSSLDDPALERVVVFFAGSPFPQKEERVIGVGWAAIAAAVIAEKGISESDLYSKVTELGDLGDAISGYFPESIPDQEDMTLLQLGEFFDELAASSGANRKTALLTTLFSRLAASEARVVAKILLSEFRIGLQEGLVEAAIARAFNQALPLVRRANMFTGDLGTTALLARAGALDQAALTVFQPIGLMLAQPEEDPQKIVDALGAGALADDKYDGIRAQIHSDGQSVKIYSRTLDEITTRFPEVADAATTFGTRFILDGEIVAYGEHILPFSVLQKRIGRRKVSESLLRDAPVVFFAFDLLLLDQKVLLDEPLTVRMERLRTLLAGSESAIHQGYQFEVRDATHLEELFDAARARANEGLVVKDPASRYTPGRRGKSWLKYKKALATLDCVVTAAEHGHGKRRGVLSDYTFAIRRDQDLLNIGKAYSGLTDLEIEKLTAHFRSITTARYGPVHLVKPEVVLEIAFDRIQESQRHKSGYALRFPRIARIRDDKTVEDISTLDDVRRIYEGQLARERPSTG